MKALERGERVEVRGMGGKVLFVGAVEHATDSSVSVLPDGKSKAKTVKPSAVRRIDVAPRTRAPKARPAIAPPPSRVATRTAEHALKAVPKPSSPLRDTAYLDFVRHHPCCHCKGREKTTVEAHHWQPKRGVGQKVDDRRTVPLCNACHRSFHETGAIGHLDARTTRELFLSTQTDLLIEWDDRRRAA